nr:hypothetical protein [Prescottella agglutinans]
MFLTHMPRFEAVRAGPAVGNTRMPVFGDELFEVVDAGSPHGLPSGGGVPVLRPPVETESVELREPFRRQRTGAVASIAASIVDPASERESGLADPRERNPGVAVHGHVPLEMRNTYRPLLGVLVDPSLRRIPHESERVELRDPLIGERSGAVSVFGAAAADPGTEPHSVTAHEPGQDASVAVFGNEVFEVFDSVHPERV